MSVFDSVVRFGLPLAPKFLIRSVAFRYVAGEDLSDAMTCVRALNREGATATADVLGEEVTESAKAEAAVEEYMRLCDAIDREAVDCNVSVKPTLLGLKIDESFCRDNIDRVAARAKDPLGDHPARCTLLVCSFLTVGLCCEWMLEIKRRKG